MLTVARIWSTVATDAIRSKPAAADWAIAHLPEQYQSVMKRAKAICKGEEQEYWNDIGKFIKPCADFIMTQINNMEINLLNNTNKSIKLAEQ